MNSLLCRGAGALSVLVSLVVATFLIPMEARAQNSNRAREEQLRSARSLRHDGCEGGGVASGFASASLLDGSAGTPRSACLRTELGLAGMGFVVARPAEFYGVIRLGAVLSGRLQLDADTELFADLEVFRREALLSAVSSTYLGLGFTSIGASRRVFAQEDRSWLVFARGVLPTAFGRSQHSLPWTVELGSSIEWRAHQLLRAQAALSLLSTFATSDVASPSPRFGGRLTLGVAWTPVDWFSWGVELMGGAGLRSSFSAIERDAGALVDVVAAQTVLRLGLGDRVGLELHATLPFAGSEQALAAAMLHVRVRLD